MYLIGMPDDVPLEVLLAVPRPPPDGVSLLLYLGLKVPRRRQPGDAHTSIRRGGERLHLPELIPDREASVVASQGKDDANNLV